MGPQSGQPNVEKLRDTKRQDGTLQPVADGRTSVTVKGAYREFPRLLLGSLLPYSQVRVLQYFDTIFVTVILKFCLIFIYIVIKSYCKRSPEGAT